MSDKYQEVAIMMIAGTIVFLVFAGIIVFFLFMNQKKKFRHAQDILSMRENFKTESLRTQLEIQEQTFNNISQEIHDNVGQILSLAKVQINIMNESETMSKEMLNEVKENVGKAMTDLRDIAKSLSSERIRSLSMHSAISNEAERINKSGVSQISVSVEGEEKKMNEQKKLILFRIIQESLQNSIKHANASRIGIQFQYGADNLQVIIKDNGKGFDTEEAVKKNNGLGLLNIKTRAALTGGSSTIESKLNEGTTINITIPYE
ncbi:MAG: hypothetical protein JST09_10290 [Bacteroidetes bacterium]|nr:hypothetical protein [Bacteroidota bacterium]